MSTTPAGCPIHAGPRTGLKLAYDSHDRIAEAFAGFTPLVDTEGDVRRGGCPREGIVRAPARRERMPDYHLEASFTPEQLSYITIASAALNMLAQGRLLHRNRPAPVLPLERAIRMRYLSDGPSQGSFYNSTAMAVYDIFTAFGYEYPNLMPAVQSASSIGLVVGTALAAHQGGNSLRHAMAYRELSSTFTEVDSTAHNFTKVHTAGWSGPDAYEVWCPGEALARNIIRRSGQAAIALAGDPHTRNMYRFLHEVPPIAHPYFIDQLDTIIDEGTAAAQARYRHR